jgi:AcrR family transcriptional regulator
MDHAKPSQRERLTRAMIASAARYGYGQASVARVVGQAGVSRATFYEHFRDKEDCFLAAYREVGESTMADLRRVYDDPVWENRRRGVISYLLEGAERNPATARMVLIESLAAGPAVRAEHEQIADSIEASIEEYLSDGPDGSQLEIPARALLGAVWGVIANRVLRGETGRLVELADDLDAWLAVYALPPGRRRRRRAEWEELGASIASPSQPLPTPLDTRLPRGRAALPAASVAGEQRLRVFASIARLCREKGYAATTVADVVATAGVSREAFYEQFRGKEDAFLSAQAYALENSVSIAAADFFRAGAWPERLWRGASTTLRYVAGLPDLSTLDFVESYAVGTPAIRRSFEGRMAYTLFLQEGYRQRPQAESLPRICSEAIAGAILELMRRQALQGEVERAPELLPQIAYLALTPFIGLDSAMRRVEDECAKSRRERPSERSLARPPAS